MPNPKVAIGVAWYGQQDPNFWIPLANIAGTLHKLDIEYMGVIGVGSMMTDSNRNNTVKQFLETDADWLYWVDTDNIAMAGGIKRLISVNKTLVSGLYFSKKEPYHPIAYYRNPNNLYRPINEDDFTYGEIIPVHAAGMGCLLSHRSVFEDMLKCFTIYKTRERGELKAYRNDRIVGKPPMGYKEDDQDNYIVNGVYHERLEPVPDNMKEKAFPWFQITGGRTEDMLFFENAEVAGHKLWLDTSVGSGHFRYVSVDANTRQRFRYRVKKIDEPRTPENLPIVIYTPDLEIAEAELESA